MRTLLVIGLLAFVGCSKTTDQQDQKAAIATITVDQLDQMLAQRACQPVDANGGSTRKKLGVIPTAILLSDYDTFAASELPADKAKPLVFYCASTECGASHHAAEKALTAGYTNVKVLPVGIAGWVKAGKQTTAI